MGGGVEGDLVEQGLVLRGRPPAGAEPWASHHSRWPAAGSGTVASSTCSAAQVPEGASPASTRPQRPARPARSASSSRAKAGWVTESTAVRVWRWGSWIIAAPDGSSTCRRSDAASPGRASVPAGRGLDGRARNSV